MEGNIFQFYSEIIPQVPQIAGAVRDNVATTCLQRPMVALPPEHRRKKQCSDLALL